MICARALALGELEGTAGLAAAVLLALHDASVAGKEPALLENRTQFRLAIGERLGNAMANRTGLARKAAALHGGDDVVLPVAVGGYDRLLQDHLQHRASEIFAEFLVVDDDLARARLHPNAGDRVLAFAGSVGPTMGVELLHVHRSFRSSCRLGGRAEFLEGVDFSHRPRPLRSSCSAPQCRASRAAAPRVDGRYWR